MATTFPKGLKELVEASRMKYSMIAVAALAMIGTSLPQAAASYISCTTVAPVDLVCESEVIFVNGTGIITTDTSLPNATGLGSVTVSMYARTNAPNQDPPVYAAVPSYTCTVAAAVASQCDGTFLAAAGARFLLVVEIDAGAGLWGWNFEIPSPAYL